MKATLYAVGCMSLLCVGGNVIPFVGIPHQPIQSVMPFINYARMKPARCLSTVQASVHYRPVNPVD
jgi:hypothetical protein